MLLFHGLCYPQNFQEDGQPDYWSRFIKVKSQPLVDPLYFIVEYINTGKYSQELPSLELQIFSCERQRFIC